jgi:hypothetical protein
MAQFGMQQQGMSLDLQTQSLKNIALSRELWIYNSFEEAWNRGERQIALSSLVQNNINSWLDWLHWPENKVLLLFESNW